MSYRDNDIHKSYDYNSSMNNRNYRRRGTRYQPRSYYNHYNDNNNSNHYEYSRQFNSHRSYSTARGRFNQRRRGGFISYRHEPRSYNTPYKVRFLLYLGIDEYQKYYPSHSFIFYPLQI